MKLNKIAGVLFTAIGFFSTLEGTMAPSVKPNGCKGPVLCPSFPVMENCEDCCSTWHVDVGLLYQQPGTSGLTTGLVSSGQIWLTHQTSAAAAVTINKPEAKLNYKCYDYCLGVEASVGHLMDYHDYWFLLAKFDWLQGKINKLYNVDNTYYGVSPLFAYGPWNDVWLADPVFVDTLRQGFKSVDMVTSIDIYEIDVLMSRGAFLSTCYSFEPYMEVKALWYNTNEKYTYNGTWGADTALTNARLKSSSDAWGVGPGFGFNGQYFITQGLALFSENNIAVTFGQVRGSNNSQINIATPSDNNGFIKNYNLDCIYFVPMRTTLGLVLSSYCLNDTQHVALKVGYDARVIMSWGQDNLAYTAYIAGGQSQHTFGYTMNGLLAKLEWSF